MGGETEAQRPHTARLLESQVGDSEGSPHVLVKPQAASDWPGPQVKGGWTHGGPLPRPPFGPP